MAKQIGTSVAKKGLTVKKRTSQGLRHFPKNKHQRRRWKHYVGQGRP